MKIKEFIKENILYIFILIFEFIAVFMTKDIVHIVVMIWITNAMIQNNIANYYRKENFKEFQKGLELAIFSDKLYCENIAIINKQQRELERYKPVFKARKRWKINESI